MTTATRLWADFKTPHGNDVRFVVRADTSDWNTCNAITAVGDEYHLPSGLSGWALDVGAHIGVCAVALLVDNPDLRVVAIEALPENVELIHENLAVNDVADRCIVIEGAAGDGQDCRIGYGEVTDPTRIHEFIGNVGAPAGSREVMAFGVDLAEALDRIGFGETVDIAGQVNPVNIGPKGFVWAKLDCEGCEYPFLESPLVRHIDHIEGEVHQGWDRLVAILDKTHVVTGDGKDFGAFTAVRRA